MDFQFHAPQANNQTDKQTSKFNKHTAIIPVHGPNVALQSNVRTYNIYARKQRDSTKLKEYFPFLSCSPSFKHSYTSFLIKCRILKEFNTHTKAILNGKVCVHARKIQGREKGEIEGESQSLIQNINSLNAELCKTTR